MSILQPIGGRSRLSGVDVHLQQALVNTESSVIAGFASLTIGIVGQERPDVEVGRGIAPCSLVSLCVQMCRICPAIYQRCVVVTGQLDDGNGCHLVLSCK